MVDIGEFVTVEFTRAIRAFDALEAAAMRPAIVDEHACLVDCTGMPVVFLDAEPVGSARTLSDVRRDAARGFGHFEGTILNFVCHEVDCLNRFLVKVTSREAGQPAFLFGSLHTWCGELVMAPARNLVPRFAE